MVSRQIHVSIIIPVYNVEKYIGECLESILEQKDISMEIICIDDVSSDHSISIIREYASKDSRIVIYQNKVHRGVSYSRNTGLEYAEGDYIFFMDADDKLKENALSDLYGHAIKELVDGVLFDAEVMYDDDIVDDIQGMKEWIVYKNKRSKQYDGVYEGCELFVDLYKNKDFDPCVWRQFWRRKFLLENQIKFCNNIIHEDRVFSFQTILLAKKVTCRKECYYIYRRRKNSITSNVITYKNIEGMLEGLCQMLLFWNRHSYKQEINDSILKYLRGTYLYTKELIHKMDYSSAREEIILGSHMSTFLYDILELEDEKKSVLSFDEIRVRMQEVEHIIVYGAGHMGRRTIKELDKLDIAISAVAVTKKNDSKKSVWGHKIYELDELIPYKDNSIVILATTNLYHNEMEGELIKRGFYEYIKLDTN